MLKLGIIGAGRIGKVHLRSLSARVPNAQAVAVADPFMDDGLRAFCQGLGIEKVFKDHHKILEDPEISAVLVCSSTDTHAEISIEAIRAGKHVFCEKPVDHSVSRIKEVENELKLHPEIKFQVGFNRRFDHNFAAIRRAYDEGKIGKAQILKITSRDPEPPDPAYIKSSGGIFLDMSIHDFDMARFLTNSEVEEVYVNSAVLIDPAIGEQGDADTAVITMKMSCGALAVIDNSRKAVYGYDQRAELFGSKGMVFTSNDTPSSAVIADANGLTGEKPLYFFLERYMESYAEELRQFVSACERDTEVPVGIHAGLEAVRIALAADKSAREHRPVRLSEIA